MSIDFYEVSNKIADNTAILSATQDLQSQTELLAVAGEIPRLMLLAHRVEHQSPDYSNAVENVFEERVAHLGSLFNDGPARSVLGGVAELFDGFSFYQNRDEIMEHTELSSLLSALDIPSWKRDELFLFIDEGLPSVLSKISDYGSALPITPLPEYGSMYGPPWQHLSPWNWVTFAGDACAALSVVTGGMASLFIATPPIFVGMIVSAGVLNLAGASIKNRFEN